MSATSITAQTGTTAIPIQGLGKAGAGEGISALVAATAGLSQQGSGTVPRWPICSRHNTNALT